MKCYTHNMELIVAANIVVIILEIIGLYISISDRKWSIFAYYTQISNIVTIISSAVLVCSGSNMFSVTLRYLSSCMLTMTFLITLFVLVPMGGGFKRLMLSGNGLYHHTLCPIISVTSYGMLEQHSQLWILPTVITYVYGIIMLIMNAKGKFDGPYPFFRVHHQSKIKTVIWMVILTGIIAGISLCMTICAPVTDKDIQRNEGGITEVNSTEKMEFKRITLSLSGSMAYTREYETLKTKNGMEASLYEGDWNYNKLVTRRSCRAGHATWGKSEYESLAARLYMIGVPSWDGFNETDPNVLDGSSFSLEIELADGNMITAHGNNAYPENYREFENLLDEAVNGPKEY